jgi:hypothetical protein
MSRNKREGHYVGKWLRRNRRSKFGKVGEQVNPGAKAAADFKYTRRQRRYLEIEYEQEQSC